MFNVKYNCYVVLEFKVSELKKEHIGQIQIYKNYIDENVKSVNHNKTIGIIITKENNKFIMHYCGNDRIIAREYELKLLKIIKFSELKKFKLYLIQGYILVTDSSERHCLFDKVSRECYYNQGEGEFLYG